MRAIIRSKAGLWYIERYDHIDSTTVQKNEAGIERTIFSSRLGEGDNNCVICGTRQDMLNVAHAILDCSDYHSHQCALFFVKIGFQIFSPRESTYPVFLPTTDAVFLADAINMRLL